jgi:hypothetical protein
VDESPFSEAVVVVEIVKALGVQAPKMRVGTGCGGGHERCAADTSNCWKASAIWPRFVKWAWDE